jgi:phosphoribosylanthranilate isomerase
VSRSDEMLRFELAANAFLHRMVRNIVGCLVYVGAGRQPPHWMAELLASAPRVPEPSPSMRTRVKICGVTNADDARAAVDAGADAIGMILGYRKSARCIAAEEAARIASSLPPFVTAVMLFVDASPEFVREAARLARPQLLQFHGTAQVETPEYCAQFGLPWVKAVHMGEGVDLLQYARRYREGRGLVLDAHVAGLAGGTGRSFDWSRVPAGLGLPVVLSGGLASGNVAEAMRRVRPAAVDVASGVERDDDKTRKDHAKIRAFIQAVRDTDAEFESTQTAL